MSHPDRNRGGVIHGFLNLPNELFREVLDFLTRGDLKRIRLVCSRLRDLAAPLVFTTAVLAVRRGVFEAFKALSNHPELRQHITEIVYDGSWLESETAKWYADAEKGLMDGPVNDLTSPAGRAKYIEVFHEQERIRETELEVALQHAARGFPKLRRLIYADYVRFPCFRWDRLEDLGGEFRLSGLWNQRAVADVEASNAGLLDSLMVDDMTFRRKHFGLVTFLKVLSQQDCEVEMDDLQLGDSTYSRGAGGIPDTIFETLTNGSEGPPAAFKSLRKLDITFSSVSEDRMNLRFDRFRHLELLRIVGPTCSPTEMSYAPPRRRPDMVFPGCCEDSQWTNLRALELRWVGTNAESLIAFLYRHRDNLRFINLHEIYISGKQTSCFIATHLGSMYPSLETEPNRDWYQSNTIHGQIIINFTLHHGEATLTNMSQDAVVGENDEDGISSYSADGDPYEEERYSSEDLDFSEGGDELLDDDVTYRY
ncbi:MAG: hypothetical protein Q9201_001280 [Fulgogasparrea decipioides]